MTRPTHFLSLPIGHHHRLRTIVRSFQNGLLNNSPPIPGLDNAIVIDPRRMHLTLGVMTLHSDNTLQSALNLLRSLKPQIMEILAGSPLRVPLNRMDIMNGDPSNAHVLWLGPALVDDDARRLNAVCNLIHRSFKAASFIVENRPLKLHCTILNTSQRKPRGQPFSYSAVLASSVFQDVKAAVATNRTSAVPVNFGVWSVDEVQICAMGSHGPENEYISSGGISLS